MEKIGLAEADVFGGGQLIADEVLEDDAHLAAHGIQVVLSQVEAIQQNAAGGRIVQPQKQFYNGGLAGAVAADQRETRVCIDGKGEVAQHVIDAARIGEEDVIEGDAADPDELGRHFSDSRLRPGGGRVCFVFCRAARCQVWGRFEYPIETGKEAKYLWQEADFAAQGNQVQLQGGGRAAVEREVADGAVSLQDHPGDIDVDGRRGNGGQDGGQRDFDGQRAAHPVE